MLSQAINLHIVPGPLEMFMMNIRRMFPVKLTVLGIIHFLQTLTVIDMSTDISHLSECI